MKRWIAVLTAFALLLSLAAVSAGCQKKSGKSSSQSASKSTPSFVYTPASALVIGIDPTFAPMGFKSGGDYTGFDVDCAREVAKRLGMSLQVKEIKWADKDAVLNSGAVNCIWNGYSASIPRNDAFTLSQGYMIGYQVAVVKKDSKIVTFAGLKGKKVAVAAGSSALEILNKNTKLKKTFAKLDTFTDCNDAVSKVESGGYDAIFIDQVFADYAIKNGKDLKILSAVLAKEKYVIAFQKGNSTLRNMIQNQMQAMKNDGTLAQISTKWFGSDVTLNPNGTTVTSAPPSGKKTSSQPASGGKTGGATASSKVSSAKK